MASQRTRTMVLLLGACMPACGKATPPVVEPEPVERPLVRVPEPSPEPPVQPPVDAPQAIEEVRVEGYDEVAEVLAERWASWRNADFKLAVARRGPVRLAPDGDDLGLADGVSLPAARRLKVIEDSERPRVVADEAGVRLLLHVDRADLQPVLLARAPLRPQPELTFHDPPRRGHVIVEHGTWVDVLEVDGAATKVRWSHPDAERSGWVDTAVLGTTAPLAPPRADSSRASSLMARRETKLLVRPGGKTLTTVGEHEEVTTLTAKATKGHRLVEYRRHCEDEVSYVGFVAVKDLFQPNYGMGYGCGRGSPRYERPWGFAQSAPRTRVEAGRVLLELERPRVIGCVVDPTELADLGGGVYAVATVWGPVPVRLAPESFEAACGAKS